MSQHRMEMTMHRPVELVNYDREWPVAFQRIRAKLAALLPQALAIDHVAAPPYLI